MNTGVVLESTTARTAERKIWMACRREDRDVPMTMLFCDLVGSTQLSTALSAQDFGKTLMHYYVDSSEVVDRWGGRTIEYVGDAVVAVFDDAANPQTDAHNAICAAMELVDVVSKITVTQRKRRASLKLDTRISVASGMGIRNFVQGIRGDRHELIFGQVPYLAARLNKHAAPKTVIVSGHTAHLAGARCQLSDLGAIRLRGFANSVAAWRVESTCATPALPAPDKLKKMSSRTSGWFKHSPMFTAATGTL